MGNFASCVLSTSQGCDPKVIFPGGEVRSFAGPTKAAELMLETPNHFLVNSRSLHVGRRFLALNADEDLEMSNVYVMFPMKKRNSVVAAGDMGSLFVVANKAAKKRGSGGSKGRILPECFDAAGCTHDIVDAYESPQNLDRDRDDDGGSLKLNLDDIEDCETQEFMHRLSMSRSKKPLLETITEEPRS